MQRKKKKWPGHTQTREKLTLSSFFRWLVVVTHTVQEAGLFSLFCLISLLSSIPSPSGTLSGGRHGHPLYPSLQKSLHPWRLKEQVARKRGSVSPGNKILIGWSKLTVVLTQFDWGVKRLVGNDKGIDAHSWACECAGACLKELSGIRKQPYGVSDVCPTTPLRAKSDSRKHEPEKFS